MRAARPSDTIPLLDSRPCLVNGCGAAPTLGKPYCFEHLARLPYVLRLKKELARRGQAFSTSPLARRVAPR
jgi:hypothetical protein